MKPVKDLRSALALLESVPGQLLRTDEPVDPMLQLAAVYRVAGAGTPVAPPTRLGPAMLFQNVKGYPGWRMVTGVMASRQRAALLLGTTPSDAGFRMLEALRHPIPPEITSDAAPPCQQVVHTESLDIMRLLPVPTSTAEDAGPYFCMGLLRATDPETGEHDVTIHRLCVQGPDTMSVFFAPGRHIDAFRAKAEAMGRALPVSVSVGLDPAVYLSCCFEPPTTPQGMDELSIAGALRGVPVELARCVTVPEYGIAHAEIVLEGEILPGVRMREDQTSNTGHAMPEFPGYNGPAHPSLSVIRVSAITHRRNPILQTLVGPGEEHVNLAGIPTEASIWRAVEDAMPGRLRNVYLHSAGGGKFLAILQFRKASASDEGRQRQAALIAMAIYHELKHVILVDEDVDPFDSNEVLWAMTTRYQGDISTIFLPGVTGHPLDPSQSPLFNPGLRQHGTTCKTIFDCTAPWHLRDRFARAGFQAITPEELGRFLVPSVRPFDED